MLANILTLIVRCQLTPYSYVCDVSVPETQNQLINMYAYNFKRFIIEKNKYYSKNRYSFK